MAATVHFHTHFSLRLISILIIFQSHHSLMTQGLIQVTRDLLLVRTPAAARAAHGTHLPAALTHLPELLVDDTKLECVVDLVLIISHYHLGGLQ